MSYEEDRDFLIELERSKGKTLQELGKTWGISRERVRQILAARGFRGRVPLPRKSRAKRATLHSLLRKSELNQERLQVLRITVLNGYGGKCACCGESEPIFLEVDHVNGGGAEHRAKGMWMEDLIARNFPSECQLLCANCHRAKTRGIRCPHKTAGTRQN